MIFITVGTQLSFDRMVQALDHYFENSDEEVFAQTGESSYRPVNIPACAFISPTEADAYFQKASLIIAHAGMGSILTALKYQKPIVIMPRKASLGEHRNEHQIATANWVKALSGVWVAEDEVELIKILEDFKHNHVAQSIPEFAEPRLIDFLATEIQR